MVTNEESFDFIAGWPALDFANSFAAAGESGVAYPTLLRWSEQAATLSAADARRLRRQAGRQPDRSREVVARALTLATAVRRICEAIIEGDRPRDAELASLNAELAMALAHLQVVARNRSFVVDFPTSDDRLDRVLWPVARSAADLLVAPELDRLKACDSPTCHYLFVDASKPGRRRWCDMKACGNRHKARRYRRKKGQKPDH